MSTSYKIPKKYNGTSDLFDHIEKFEASIDPYNAPDATKCKAFPITLEENVGNWF